MKYRFKGLNEYVEKLERLSNRFNAEACIEFAVQDGAAVVADYTRKELENLPVDNRPFVAEGKRTSIMQVQKVGLLHNFGTSPIQDRNNLINIKTGVDDYNKIGQPNVKIARSLERGTSFMPKNAVFTRASRKARKPCLDAIQKSLNESIEAICANNFRRSKRK